MQDCTNIIYEGSTGHCELSDSDDDMIIKGCSIMINCTAVSHFFKNLKPTVCKVRKNVRRD